MSSTQSSWRGLRLGEAVLDYGKAKEALWEVKRGFALLLAFSVPSQQAAHESPGPQRGCFPGAGSQGHGERECLVPVLMFPQENTPHTVLQGKDRLGKTELVAWHHLD